jgi:hypothetical protein
MGPPPKTGAERNTFRIQTNIEHGCQVYIMIYISNSYFGKILLFGGFGRGGSHLASSHFVK